MKAKLFRKLTINTLNELENRLGLEECSMNDPLFKNISEKEFETIRKEWIKNCPEKAKEYENQMNFSLDIIDLLIKKYW